jgi:hypothetical protein
MSDETTDIVTPTPARWWTAPASWSVVISLALVIYELTDQTGLATAIGCSKFGWKDFLTARWLRRVDPDPGRARACCWFYLSAGLWKITLAAFVAISIIVAVEEWVIRRPLPQLQAMRNDPPLTFKAGAVTVAVSLALAVLSGHVAFWTALRRRCKVWVDFAVHQARVEGRWPPPYRRWNLAGLLLLGVFALSETAVAVLAIWIVGSLLPPGPLVSIVLGLGLLGMILVSPGLTDRYAERVVAQDPAECWGDTPEGQG